MYSSFTRIQDILSANDRRQFHRLLLVMVVMGVLEVAGIGSLMPFIAAVSNMDAVLDNRYARYIYDLLGFDSRQGFVIALGAVVLALLVARNLWFALANWLVSRVTFGWRQHLSERLLERYLVQPYTWFLPRNTLELKRKACNETERLVGRVIIPGIQVLTSTIITLFVAGLLIIIDPVVALAVTAGLGGSYLLLYGLVYRKLSRLSGKANRARREQFKIAGEALEGIKEVKLFGKESVFVGDYSNWSRQNARLETTSRAISQLPRHGIEILAVSGVMGFILYLVASGQQLAPWMPVLGVYIVSGYRLLPALQRIFSGITSIQYNLPTLHALYEDLTGLPQRASFEPADPHARRQAEPLESIALRDVSLRYPGAQHSAIRQIDLDIARNTTVGLVGPTGSGKTTLVDIIMGLLLPTSGELAVNGVAVTPENVGTWQRRIGYVPQHIYLFDDTLARNVAFGIADEDIDAAALEHALLTANLCDFVASLPAGHNSMLGQRGVRLSGGQRQRIGIARALYRRPDVLVLDEATSALDGVTESGVIDAIQKLSHTLTIVMIAHRLNSVKNCDVIHYVDNGRVLASGAYSELADACEPFRTLVNL